MRGIRQFGKDELIKHKETFVGLDKLKAKHNETFKMFEESCKNGNFKQIHNSHYDWWMFPTDERSSFQLEWTVTEKYVKELLHDEAYIKELRAGVELLLFAWGWDSKTNKPIEDPSNKFQAWSNWPVRLYKCGRSCQVFGFSDLFDSCLAFAKFLESKNEDLNFSSSHTKKRENVLENWETEKN